jgi:hypothetical protein
MWTTQLLHSVTIVTAVYCQQTAACSLVSVYAGDRTKVFSLFVLLRT